MTAAPYDLVTLATAKAWLGITSITDDANIQFAISAYSQLIASWCSRNFVSASYSDVYDGHGGARLMTKNWPITAVSSLSVDGRAITAATSVLGAGYQFNDRSVILNGCDQFCRGLQNIQISYTAGFVTIPMDLQMACLEWMKSAYLSRMRDDGIISRRAGDTEEKYSAGGAITILNGEAAPMPASVYAVLSQYRNNLPV